MAGAVPGPAATSRRSRSGRFRRWRRTRPFWGAFLVILGGAEILASVRAPLPVILHIGLQGMAGYLVPLLLLTCGVLLLVTPAQRAFYAIVSIILALASWLTSNLGGFLIGMLLALVGGCLALAWTPRRHLPAETALPTVTTDTVVPSGAEPSSDAERAR
ncbi:hypothetical protein GA0070618_5807 [Micromonospora echinospora]|uniref:Uncharacterized protein n=1 Tax=Micromonospora echinospora TaxID=1877 RepID=A0A1C4ZUN8_MICEC|nr:DUF6114 domain-containing protein [Micromonospora echinospora]SCF36655.1 hypothetical protein GA0070618_5807 [Micromonospora echinospora]